MNEAQNSPSSKIFKDKLGDGFDLGIALPSAFGFIAATSIELLLKACVIEKMFKEKLTQLLINKKRVSEEEVDIGSLHASVDFYTHDLNKLANTSGIELTLKDINFLKILTHAIYWAGRYPIPRKEEILNEYSLLLDELIFLPKHDNEEITFLEFDQDMILNCENYEKIWVKIEIYYETIVISN